MKSVIIVFLIVFSFCNSSYSQENTAENDFLDGKVLLFHLSGLSALDLKTINGGIGFSYKLSKFIYHRNILKLNTHKGILEDSYNSNEESFYSIYLKSDFVNILKMRQTFRPYWGYGLQLGYTTSEYKYTNTVGSNSITKGPSSYSLGVEALIGIEYFLKDNISLTAEYTGTLMYNFRDNNNSSNLPNIKSINYNQDTIGLLIAFYL